MNNLKIKTSGSQNINEMNVERSYASTNVLVQLFLIFVQNHIFLHILLI